MKKYIKIFLSFLMITFMLGAVVLPALASGTIIGGVPSGAITTTASGLSVVGDVAAATGGGWMKALKLAGAIADQFIGAAVFYGKVALGAYFVGYALYWLIFRVIFLLIWFASYNGFGTAVAVTFGWGIVRDIANMFFIVILLVIAIATILKIEKYEWKQHLPRLLIMAVLINFSRTISLLLIDISQVVMLTFVNTFSDAISNFFWSFGITDFVTIGSSGGVGSTILTTLAIPAMMVVNDLFLVAILFALAAMTWVVLSRIITLWILIVLSPAAYLASTFPRGEKYYEEWWEEFVKNLLVGPILAFFIWLSLQVLGTLGAPNAINDFFGNPLALKQLPKDALDSGAGTIGFESVVRFVLAIAMFLIGLEMAQKLSTIGGEVVGKIAHLTTEPFKTAAEGFAARVGIPAPAKWAEMAKKGFQKVEEQWDTTIREPMAGKIEKVTPGASILTDPEYFLSTYGRLETLYNPKKWLEILGVGPSKMTVNAAKEAERELHEQEKKHKAAQELAGNVLTEEEKDRRLRLLEPATTELGLSVANRSLRLLDPDEINRENKEIETLNKQIEEKKQEEEKSTNPTERTRLVAVRETLEQRRVEKIEERDAQVPFIQVTQRVQARVREIDKEQKQAEMVGDTQRARELAQEKAFLKIASANKRIFLRQADTDAPELAKEFEEVIKTNHKNFQKEVERLQSATVVDDVEKKRRQEDVTKKQAEVKEMRESIEGKKAHTFNAGSEAEKGLTAAIAEKQKEVDQLKALKDEGKATSASVQQAEAILSAMQEALNSRSLTFDPIKLTDPTFAWMNTFRSKLKEDMRKAKEELRKIQFRPVLVSPEEKKKIQKDAELLAQSVKEAKRKEKIAWRKADQERPAVNYGRRRNLRGAINKEKSEMITDNWHEQVSIFRDAMKEGNAIKGSAALLKATEFGNENEFLNAFGYRSNAEGIKAFTEDILIRQMRMGRDEAMAVANDVSYKAEGVKHWEAARAVNVKAGELEWADEEYRQMELTAEMRKLDQEQLWRNANRLAWGYEEPHGETPAERALNFELTDGEREYRHAAHALALFTESIRGLERIIDTGRFGRNTAVTWSGEEPLRVMRGFGQEVLGAGDYADFDRLIRKVLGFAGRPPGEGAFSRLPKASRYLEDYE